MIDDVSRSRSVWRERALAATRRRLKRLEIETHRIKAELARLESENESDIADELTHELREDGVEIAALRTSDPTDSAVRPRHERVSRIDLSPNRLAIQQSADAAKGNSPELARPNDRGAKEGRQRVKRRRSVSPAWWLSLGLHAAVLAVLAPLTFVILTNEQVPLFASMFDMEESSLDEPGAVPIELASFEEVELQEVALQDMPSALAENLVNELSPVADSATTESTDRLGQLNSLPTDVGTLMAGGGKGGAGATTGGPIGSAQFFGTQSRGDRFVFVVDNSSSMKDGRLEAALDELIRSVEALSRRQSFYVIFVSDQPYPMFYPEPATNLLPATAPNKQRLREWLGRVILAAGKNRELIKAMDMAAALEPHAVYLLWDGDMRYSERVREDVMIHLTRPNQWKFTIHTLGMGINSLDSEHKLTAIAQAHGGTYHRVQVAAPVSRKRP